MSIIDKIADRMDDHGNLKTAETLERAFIFLIPIFLVGAGATAIQNFPVTAVREFIATALNGSIARFFTVIYDATYGFTAVYLAIAIAYCSAKSNTLHSDAKVFLILSTVISYFASLGNVLLDGETDVVVYTNMTNIFPAIIISLLSVRLFLAIYKLIYKTRSDRSSSFVRATHAIIPLACCVTVFGLAGTLIGLIPEARNFNDLLSMALEAPFKTLGATYLGELLIMLAESVLWFFGIHGGNAFENVLNGASGEFAATNGGIVSKSFIDTFALMGGCGTSICLIIALLAFSHDRKKRKLCRLSGVPIVFNINELLVFGLPVVLNPVYLIPFILTPVACYSVAYLATLWGIIPRVTATVQWTTPILISGYQATGSVAGLILQLVLLLLGFAIYAPFVLLDNSLAEKNSYRYLTRLTEVCKDCERKGVPYSVDEEKLALRTFEDDLAAKLYNDITHGEITLKYQPQVRDGKIVSAEALLRESYGNSGYLYPPLVVAVAAKNDLFEQLSREIVKRALKDLKFAQSTAPDLKVTVNLTLDLLMDENFRKWLLDTVDEAHVTPHTFGVEITEDARLSDAVDYTNVFGEISRAGINVLMDDFSMGHTSLAMLQKNYFDVVKIDGNLIKQLDNERIRSIVSSIVRLGKELNFKVIAEYVETEKQRDILLNMGCYIFQGYLYYKDLTIDELRRATKY